MIARVRTLLLAVLAALAAGAAALAGGAQATTLPVSIYRTPLTAPLPQGFLGIALEYNTVPQWVGPATTAGQVDPVLVQLLHNLNPTGQSLIRIGGQSTDRSWWPVPNTATPAGVTYALGPTWAQAAQLLAQRLNAKYILSVNLEANSPQISSYEANQLVASIGAQYIGYFEIGNEPDLYTRTPWYRVVDGKQVPWYDRVGTPYFARSSGWDEAQFLTEFESTLTLMPQIPIAGPDAANAQWLGPFSALVPHTTRIGMLDSHAYGLFSCVSNPASPRYPSIPNLLSPSAVSRVMTGAAPFVGIAHHDRLQFRIDEMGSVSCDGKNGVSNTMASALWATDALFLAARGGVDGVNLHSFPGSTNGLFDLTDGAQGWSADVHPIYYGALMFALADPEGSRILSIPSPLPPDVHVWATLAPDHRVRVLIINDGPQQVLTIHAPLHYGSREGTLERLQAPSVASETGITLGGQTFGTATPTGALPALTPLPDRPGRGGYTVTAPPGTETLLTLSLPGRSTGTTPPAKKQAPKTQSGSSGGSSPARSIVRSDTAGRTARHGRSSAR